MVGYSDKYRIVFGSAIVGTDCGLYSFSVQNVVADEAETVEWHEGALVSSKTLFLRDLLEHFGMDVKVEIRLETQECQTLWVQKKVKMLENVVASFSRD